MHAVVGIGRVESTGLVAGIDKARVVVDKQDALFFGERFETLVEGRDFVGTAGNLLAPSE